MTREGAAKHIELFKRCERLGGAIEAAFDMAIAALREQPRWISVDERLPEENVQVLCFRDGCIALSEIYATDFEGGAMWSYTGIGGDPTHWMPLPETPKEEVWEK